MDLRRFEGKNVLVTGAGFGIGRGVALRFAREGARVAAMDVNQERTAETANMITSSGGVARPVVADVSKPAEVRRAVEEILSTMGTVNILVNNAGIRIARSFLETTEEEWNRTISTNLSGVFYVTKAVAPRMLADGGGKIVNVASMSGLIGQLKRAAYGASKGGELQLTRSLAVELGPTINVNAVAPGYIAGTGITADVDKDAAAVQWNLAYTPAHRAGTADDVAGAVAFLASEDASFITGATLVVDGGFTAAKFMPPS